MRRLLCLAAALALVAPAAAHARASLVEVVLGSPAELATLERLGFDLAHETTARRALVVLHDDEDRRRLADAGFPARPLVADLGAATRRSLLADARAADEAPSRLPSGRTTYRVLGDFRQELEDLATRHPGLVRRVDLPRRSVGGLPIMGLELASGVNRTDDGRPVYVVMGLTHAREWPSGEVSMELARDLADGYGTDRRITALLDRVRVVVVPVANPDGFVMSRGSDPLGVGSRPQQRKNASEVDLNRNHGAHWGGNGASTEREDADFRGPEPWSEPESAAVHELTRRLHVTNVQSIHNIGALVLRPPGFEALGLAPDEARLKVLGDRMAAAARYSSARAYELYEVTGATEDWNYVAQNAFGYTIELGGPTPEFQGPYRSHVIDQYLGPDGERDDGDGVREALLLAGEQAADPTDHSILDGTAPPGATLRLARTFVTETSPVCLAPYRGGRTACTVRGAALGLPDGVDTQLTVPGSGRFVWHVNPSTRPFERRAGRIEAYTMTCVAADGRVLAERGVVVGIGERRTLEPCTPATAAGPTGGGPFGGTEDPSGHRPQVGLRVRHVARQRRPVVLRRGVLVRASCAAGCTVDASVRRSRTAAGGAAARQPTVLGRRRLALRAERPVAFRVRLSARARRYVARRRVRRVVVRLDARAGEARRIVARGVTLVR